MTSYKDFTPSGIAHKVVLLYYNCHGEIFTTELSEHFNKNCDFQQKKIFKDLNQVFALLHHLQLHSLNR